jgi:hypothetical protein
MNFKGPLLWLRSEVPEPLYLGKLRRQLGVSPRPRDGSGISCRRLIDCGIPRVAFTCGFHVVAYYRRSQVDTGPNSFAMSPADNPLDFSNPRSKGRVMFEMNETIFVRIISTVLL